MRARGPEGKAQPQLSVPTAKVAPLSRWAVSISPPNDVRFHAGRHSWAWRNTGEVR
jgi:hypothetical protein